MPTKKILILLTVILSVVMAGCSGLKGSTTGGGGTTGTFTIGGTVSGLVGSGLVLADNGTNNLTITGNGSFVFTAAVSGAYSVSIVTQPSSPSQTCTVSNGSGTATANVTTVAVTCSAEYTIGGSVIGLNGSGLVLQDNGGDNLTITGTGTVPFTFATPVNGQYSVTILTQPSNPTQTCTVANGGGTATANVTNVQVVCATKYTIGGSVTGLSGTGLVLQDNGGDNYSVTANGTFTFATPVPGAYNVTVLTQPSNPTQTCQVANGSGQATANITNVTITCTSGFAIGGTINNLIGSGLVLQDNGGNNLTITKTGSVPFQFTNLVTGAYAVTILTQPSNPAQNCTVSNGSGTATAAVTGIQVNCGAVYSIGGQISGLLGSGLILEDTVGTGSSAALDQLPISGTGTVNFTFDLPVPTGVQYAVSVVTQPTNPDQTCSVVNGAGTATASVTTVQVVCPAPTWSIGGTLLGLVAFPYGSPNTPLPGDFVELLNNGGDNLVVTGNNQGFTFSTPVTNDGQYNVNIFLQPTSQTQPCTAFYYTGVATANVNSVIIDCQHNDWTWEFGASTVTGLGNYGQLALPPPVFPATDSNTPGGREYAMTWTDPSGQKWMFGGHGLVVSGASPEYLPSLLNDMWVFSPGANAQTGIWIPANVPTIATTTDGSTVNSPQTEYLEVPGGHSTLTSTAGPFTAAGTTQNFYYPGAPGARWGGVTWSDSSGNMYLFGGEGYSSAAQGYGLLNDLWKFTPGLPNNYLPGDPMTYYDAAENVEYDGSFTYLGTWTSVNGFTTPNVNVAGTSTWPGGRWGAAFCTDSSGKVWMFGGQGYDSAGNVGLLNDLWEYSGGTWTLVSGSAVGQQNGSYPATVGTPGGLPGGRQTATLVADTAGNLWLFGGLGLDSQGTSNPGNVGSLPNGAAPEGALLNDMWQYNIASQTWTWVSGGGATGLANQIGMYGQQQVPATGFFPGSRWNSSGWIDLNNNVWIFGGWGYASSLAQSTGFLSDVWEYHTNGPSAGLWTWWKGSSNVNQPGDYPTYLPVPLGTPFVQNQPGGRSGMPFWPDTTNGYVWMFGGQAVDASGANGYLNDLWDYLQFPNQ
jgi:hypothetical protein